MIGQSKARDEKEATRSPVRAILERHAARLEPEALEAELAPLLAPAKEAEARPADEPFVNIA